MVTFEDFSRVAAACREYLAAYDAWALMPVVRAKEAMEGHTSMKLANLATGLGKVLSPITFKLDLEAQAAKENSNVRNQ